MSSSTCMWSKIIIWILSLILVVVACSKEKEYEFPMIFTGEVTGIDSTGAVFHGKITDLGREPIEEFGFVWDARQDPLVESAERLAIRQSPREGTFQQQVATTLKDGELYFVRAYIKTEHATSYGKQVTFTSLGSKAPVVYAVDPNPANIGDTVAVTGMNFSYRLSGNVVRFNELNASIVKGNQDTLWVIVPKKLDTVASEVSVSILGNISTAEEPFRLITPKIADFSPKTGTFGSLITITGLDFLSNPASFHAWVGDLEVALIDYQDDRLVIAIPDSLDEREVHFRLGMNNLSVTSVETFRLESFILYDFSPKTTLTGESIHITGKNFSPVAANNYVMIGRLEGKISHASPNELTVILPRQDIGYYGSRENTVRVSILDEQQQFTEKLTINDPWFRLQDSPIVYYNHEMCSQPTISCFVVNEKAYIGLNGSADLWEFDPATYEWRKVAPFPGTPRYMGTGFAVGNRIYFGTGRSSNNFLYDWWEYNVDQNVWRQRANFPGNPRAGAVAFPWGNNGYMGTGYQSVDFSLQDFKDIWLYITELDVWLKMTDYPVDPDLFYGMWFGIALPSGQDTYIGLGNSRNFGYQSRIFKYFPSTNSWESMSDYPYNGEDNFPIGFNLNGKTYLKTRYSKHFWAYNEEVDKWWDMLRSDILTDVSTGIAFSIGDKAYVGLGTNHAMWEYDPSR